MSHTALRRVVVRLLHDPVLADRLATDPTATLAGADLSFEERAWLVAVPAAAWRTDADRPRRVLAALREEYPASTELAPAHAERFFRSMHFHSAVQGDGGSLAIAFGLHMADAADARVMALARLELATAAVRRAPRRISPSAPGSLRLTPTARVVRVPGHAAELLAAIHAGTGHPPLTMAEEPLLVLRTPHTGAVTIEGLEEALATLLGRVTVAVPRSELETLLRSLGAGPDEAIEVVEHLMADGLLV
jgi:hypothetical protein